MLNTIDASIDHPNVKAHKAGFQAFVEGKTSKANPHWKLSEEGIAWNRGWHTAYMGSRMK